MPLYDYKCPGCGVVHTALFHYRDRPDTIDCECGRKAGFVFPLCHLLGFEYMDFRREYRAHPEKYPSAEDNIRYCEETLGQSMDEIAAEKPKKKVKWL